MINDNVIMIIKYAMEKRTETNPTHITQPLLTRGMGETCYLCWFPA